jgi:L-threonylcarbamoyladenylate synthase
MTASTWQLARELIAGGELVAFPTDTVYGIACDPYNVDAINRLYAAKIRDRLKALPLLLSDVGQLDKVARDVPESSNLLGSYFWPGALTLVLPRVSWLPAELGGGDTIAVRVPNHPELQSFLKLCGGTLATSSANLSGEPDACTAQQAAAYLGDHVSLVIDGGRAPGGIPSTVVDCTRTPPLVLRSGAISHEAITHALAAES